jgi:hypothetical protein
VALSSPSQINSVFPGSWPAVAAIESKDHPGLLVSRNATKLTTPIPIDPALTGFPTHGPNDDVPPGFHSMPHSLFPPLATTPNMPGVPPIATTFQSTTVPHMAIPGTMSMPLNSEGTLTLERLGQMILSLETRLTLQEHHHNPVPTTSSQLPAIPVLEEIQSVVQPMVLETRPRTWPTRATPPQTRRKATQTAGDSEPVTVVNDKTGTSRAGRRTRVIQGVDLETKEQHL